MQGTNRIFKRKSILRNTPHHHSYHLQSVLTSVRCLKAKARSEKVNNLKTAMKKTHNPNRDKYNNKISLAQLHGAVQAFIAPGWMQFH